MSIASMTGFARINGCLPLQKETISWTLEAKSVNGKNLDIKLRLPTGYDDLASAFKTKAANYLKRGNVSIYLEIVRETKDCKIKIDEVLLDELTQKAIALCEKYGDKLTKPSAAELLGQRGVIETNDDELVEADSLALREKLLEDFEQLCQNLQSNRRAEGSKIGAALHHILEQISGITAQIEVIAETLPAKLKEKLETQLKQYAGDINFSEDRIAQEIVLLITRADIKEETDRLKAHTKSAFEMLEEKDAIGRKLDFLCQELNREANTTCSKAADIAITNLGMELKALIEQFREQVQNIE